MTKLKPFSRKVRQNVQNYLNLNLVIGSFLKNGFEATLSSKTNVLSVWKGHFSVFCIFLSGGIETVFWESETEPSRPIIFKVGHRKFIRNSFWSNLQKKTRMLRVFGKQNFQFFCIFWVTKLKPFSGKVRQNIKNCLNQNLVIGTFL